ncbi:squalene synthase HpnC [Comamonas koreensis]|uniref:Squalene synthase HpnC n=1 Tax=Comamonas koreensis TaxID=160825 RepID=A0AAW4XWK9_9BURK|nr:squalene synthase HpnC [Comamonas koreensis]MCD2165832.1 squalene synthase HpnC [Comamonas koreensis]
MKDSTPSSSATAATHAVTTPVTHYENFPVASWLCPPALRPPIAAIYHFARTADDIADEGDADAPARLAELQAYRDALTHIAAGKPPQARWQAVFAPLQAAIVQWQLPVALLDDLISAFMQDIDKTARSARYADRSELLDYCRRSANPVGRLLLHLYGVDDAPSLVQSDAICSALQLINFWQDLSVDIPRGRYYLNDADCQAAGITTAAMQQRQDSPALRQLVMDQAAWARRLMEEGAPLVHRVPGRAGWELRLVVQGGLRILDKVEALQGQSLWQRRTIGKGDVPLMLWRAWRM